MKDESFLNTGLSSAASRRTAEKNAERQKESVRDRAQLTPVGDDLIALIEKECADVCDVRSFVVDAKSLPEDLKAQLLARNLHVLFLDKFKLKVQNTLREKGAKS